MIHVLLLHSIGLDARAYDALRAAVGLDHEVHVYDQRAHGSAASNTTFTLTDLVDDALGAMQEIGRPVHLVGHSMGGAVAALAAACSPGQVPTLALIATPPAGLPVFAERAAAVSRDGMGAAIETTLRRWFDGETADTALAMEIGRRGLSRMNAEGFAACWRALAAFDGYALLALPPTLCIAGEGDVSTPPRAMELIVSKRKEVEPGAEIRLECVAGAGHMLPLTHPENVAALLKSHWNEHRAR